MSQFPFSSPPPCQVFAGDDFVYGDVLWVDAAFHGGHCRDEARHLVLIPRVLASTSGSGMFSFPPRPERRHTVRRYASVLFSAGGAHRLSMEWGVMGFRASLKCFQQVFCTPTFFSHLNARKCLLCRQGRRVGTSKLPQNSPLAYKMRTFTPLRSTLFIMPYK